MNIIEKWEEKNSEVGVSCCSCGWKTTIGGEYLHDTEFIKCSVCESWQEFYIREGDDYYIKGELMTTKVMKISETVWTHFVLIIDKDKMEIIHSIGYVGLPNVASLLENFEELSDDEDFQIEDIKSQLVTIVDKDSYIELMGDFEIGVNVEN